MDISAFAVWKFKVIDGSLKGFRASDLDSSRYEGARRATVTYDYRNCLMTVRFDDGVPGVTCHLRDAETELRKLGIYEIRPDSERHRLSKLPYTCGF